jgi:homoserine dehydrogenase
VTPSSDTREIALLGYGTVNGSLHRMVVDRNDEFAAAIGAAPKVTAALVRDPSRQRAGAEDIQLVASPSELLAGAPAAVVEAMGGIEPAREYVLAALNAGIPVVTANKQLVARCGEELFAAAAKNGTQLRFEASVCGAIPIVRLLRESLSPSRVDGLYGILNGTTNFVLTSMAEGGANYAAALKVAQELGYAEPDPTDDVNGADAAAKLALLAGLAFGARVDVDAIDTVGIDVVSATDIEYAHVLGCAIKPIGRAVRLDDGSLRLEVSPMLVPERHPLASVRGALNAVMVAGDPFGELTVQGPGAGGPETASALAGDLVDVLADPTGSVLNADPHLADASLAGDDRLTERCYVRMTVPDRPGVLADVAGHFANQQVSIERVIQQLGDDESATLILTTHPATMRAVRSAMQDYPQSTVLPILPLPGH